MSGALSGRLLMVLPQKIGKYRVERHLGDGGMGTVYLARDEAIDRLVAIKSLRRDDEDTRQRFRSEARAVGRLKHPNIVTVYDFGDFEGNACIVMEYVQGETLAALIRHREQIPDIRKLQLIEQVCRGLAYAHGVGIVHRDIKPSNLMVDTDGAIKIVDFGIARSKELGITRTGMLIGTLAYMAPEQARGEPVDRRCDIFSLGLVLYEFLTGMSAFPGDSDYSIVNRIATGAFEPFRHPDAVLSELIVPVLDTALAREPADRYQDADQFADALASVRARMEDKGQTPTVVLQTPGALGRSGPAEPAGPVMPPVQRALAEPAPVPSQPVSSTGGIHSGRSARASGIPGLIRHWWAPAAAFASAGAVMLAAVYMSIGAKPIRSPAPAVTPVNAAVPQSRPPQIVSEPSLAVPAPTTSEEALLAPASASIPQAALVQRDTQVPVPVSSFTARLSEAKRLFENGDYDDARAVYETVLAADPGNLAAARGLTVVRRAQAAEQSLSRAASGSVPLDDERGRRLTRLLAEGLERHSEGEYDAAIAAYQAAIEIDPSNAKAITGIGETRKAQAAEAAALGRRRKPGA